MLIGLLKAAIDRWYLQQAGKEKCPPVVVLLGYRRQTVVLWCVGGFFGVGYVKEFRECAPYLRFFMKKDHWSG